MERLCPTNRDRGEISQRATIARRRVVERALPIRRRERQHADDLAVLLHRHDQPRPYLPMPATVPAMTAAGRPCFRDEDARLLAPAAVGEPTREDERRTGLPFARASRREHLKLSVLHRGDVRAADVTE